jgi:hypothetical protein
MSTTTAVLESLKYGYGVNRVLYLFNQESPTFNILSRVKKPVGGRGQFILPIMTKNPGGFSGIVEGGSLPANRNADTAEASFSLQEYAATYSVSWKLIQDSRNDKFAFQQAVTMLDEGLRRRVMKMLNADLIDDGRGRLAVLTGADSTGVITSAFLPRCEVGQIVDVVDTDNDTIHSADNYVQAVDPIARTVTLGTADDGGADAIAGEAAGDCLVLANTLDDGESYNSLHSNGLLGVIDDADPAAVVGDYGGVDRDSANYWKSVVLSNGGTNRPLTEDLILQALDGSREKGGGKTSAILSNLSIVRRYHEMLAAERFFALSGPGTLSGGIGRKQFGDGSDAKGDGKTPYEFSSIPWHVDPYFHNNVIVGLDTDHLFLGVGENEVPRPISEIFENVPFFKTGSTASFEVNWYYQMELISDNPAGSWKIEDVAEA